MKKGFTLVELVIVIIIVGILSIVAVPIYKGYTDRAKETEGKALLGSINTAEKVYFAEMNSFYATGGEDGEVAITSNSVKLSVDARANKYYKYFKVTAGDDDDSAAFTAVVSENANLSESAQNSGLRNITLTATSTGQPTISGGIAKDRI